jgi:hypothetical protein
MSLASGLVKLDHHDWLPLHVPVVRCSTRFHFLSIFTNVKHRCRIMSMNHACFVSTLFEQCVHVTADVTWKCQFPTVVRGIPAGGGFIQWHASLSRISEEGAGITGRPRLDSPWTMGLFDVGSRFRSQITSSQKLDAVVHLF